MAQLQFIVYHFWNIKGIYTISHILEDDQLLCAIRKASIDEFWSRWSRTARRKLLILKMIQEVGEMILVLVEGIKNLGYIH